MIDPTKETIEIYADRDEKQNTLMNDFHEGDDALRKAVEDLRAKQESELAKFIEGQDAKLKALQEKSEKKRVSINEDAEKQVEKLYGKYQAALLVENEKAQKALKKKA